MTMASDFEVEHYLDHQAEIFLARFDPLTYLYLSRVMDYFDPFAERPSGTDTRFLAVSFSSDWRFGTEHSRAIVRELEAIGAESGTRRSTRRGATTRFSWTCRATRSSSRSSWRRFSVCARRWPGRATRSRSSTRRCCPARSGCCG